MSELQGTSSSWLSDLIAFLNSVFLSFTNLPVNLAQMTCMSVLQHLAKSLYGMLLSDDVKAVSMGFVQQVDLDVVQCEQFAASEPVQGLEVRNEEGICNANARITNVQVKAVPIARLQESLTVRRDSHNLLSISLLRSSALVLFLK